jgi:hypothetical protein
MGKISFSEERQSMPIVLWEMISNTECRPRWKRAIV